MSRLPFRRQRPLHIVGLAPMGAAWQTHDPAGAWGRLDFEGTSWMEAPKISEYVSQIHKCLATSNSRRIIWVIGHSLMPQWVQRVPAGIRSLAELKALAEARARVLFGTEPGFNDWHVHGEWQADKPFVCSALPAHWAKELGSDIQLVTPLLMGMAALSSSLAHPGWTIVSTTLEAHILQRSQGRWNQLRTLRLPHSLSFSQLETLIHAEWLREVVRSTAPESDLEWLHFGPCSEVPQLSVMKWANPSWQSQLRQSAARQPHAVFESEPTCNVWAYEQVMARGVSP